MGAGGIIANWGIIGSGGMIGSWRVIGNWDIIGCWGIIQNLIKNQIGCWGIHPRGRSVPVSSRGNSPGDSSSLD